MAEGGIGNAKAEENGTRPVRCHARTHAHTHKGERQLADEMCVAAKQSRRPTCRPPLPPSQTHTHVTPVSYINSLSHTHTHTNTHTHTWWQHASRLAEEKGAAAELSSYSSVLSFGPVTDPSEPVYTSALWSPFAVRPRACPLRRRARVCVCLSLREGGWARGWSWCEHCRREGRSGSSHRGDGLGGADARGSGWVCRGASG